jgi:hypothetical protein
LVTRAAHFGVTLSMTMAIAISPRASAQDYMVRDIHGRRTATVDHEGFAECVVRDNAGRRTSTISPDTTGRFVIRDLATTTNGHNRAGLSKDLAIRDAGGRRIGSIVPQSDGSLSISDRSGRRTAKVFRRER